jgi:acylphosphatase
LRTTLVRAGRYIGSMAEFPEAEPGEIVRMTARVDGVVQAVGFRYGAVRKAEGLGLTGTVRNNDDGSVGIVAEGPQARVLEFRRWLRSPEAPGRVETVDESVSAATGEFKGFGVRY